MNSPFSRPSAGARLPRSKFVGLLLGALAALPPGPLAATPTAAPAAQAATLFVVNSTGDGGDASQGDGVCQTTTAGECTLRAAIQEANAFAGNYRVNFSIPASDQGCDAAGRCTIKLRVKLPNLVRNFNIIGPGADKLTVRLIGDSGNVFYVGPGITAGFSGMTVSGAFRVESSSAAAIYVDEGAANINNCVITDNAATGILNRKGAVNVNNSTISNNVNNNIGEGGGITTRGGTTNVTNCTITGNVADTGGGISNNVGASTWKVTVTNSTIVGNFAHSSGGGIYTDTFSAEGVCEVRSSIVALNDNRDLSGEFVSGGYNLIGRTNSGFTDGVNNDQVGTDASPLDPKLDPAGLQNNGGSTKTIALLPGSPAIDRGTADGLTGPLSTDQRGTGFPRTVDNPSVANAADGTDVGAFEARPASLLQFSSAAYSVGEGISSVAITVKRTGSLAGAVTVNYFSSDGTATAGQDYTAVCGTLTFAPNQASKTFSVPITNDALDEVDETLNLALGNPTGGATLGTPNAAPLTIIDNDLPPKLSINNAAVTEGNSGSVNATFTVTLSAPSSQTVSVKYQTVNGTALAPGDYAAKALTTLTFLPGETMKAVQVAVAGDLLDEPAETFKVQLSSPTNATIATGTGTCTITDNDPAPSITVDNRTVTEPDSGTVSAVFTVKLSAASGQTVTVKYATANGTAAAGSDYTALALTTLTFTPGQTSKTVAVPVRGDLIKEANETFFLNLSAATNATIGDAQGLGTIINDD